RVTACGESLDRFGVVARRRDCRQRRRRDALLRRTPEAPAGEQPRTRRIADHEHAAEVVADGDDGERRPEAAGCSEYGGGDGDHYSEVAYGRARTQPAANQRI